MQDFWDRHINELTTHEQALARHHDHRAQVLAGACGTLVAAALAATRADPWLSAGWITQGLWLVGALLLAGAVVVFWLTLTPMEGRRFAENSLAHLLYTNFSRGRFGPPVAYAELGQQVRAAREADGIDESKRSQSAGARAILAQYLLATVRTDLSRWLDDDDPAVVDIRFRQVFWLWSNQQVAAVKAEMVQMGMTSALFGFGGLLAAVVLELLWGFFGWWLLAAVIVFLLWWFWPRMDFV